MRLTDGWCLSAPSLLMSPPMLLLRPKRGKSALTAMSAHRQLPRGRYNAA